MISLSIIIMIIIIIIIIIIIMNSNNNDNNNFISLKTICGEKLNCSGIITIFIK